MSIEFSDRLSNPDSLRKYPVITDVISYKQGETINLGKIYFGEEILFLSGLPIQRETNFTTSRSGIPVRTEFCITATWL